MKIRYNFELQSDKSDEFEPWLHEIFKNIEIQGINNFTIRVLKTKTNRRIDYLFINKKNKTYVAVTKRKEHILISGYYRGVPDNAHIKPLYILEYEEIYNNTNYDKFKAVTSMLSILDRHTVYSEKSLSKINVNCTNVDLPDIDLLGGYITGITVGEHFSIIATVNGRTFCTLNKVAEDNKVSVGKFIIFNPVNNASDVFFPSEVDQYYTLITNKN